MYTYLLANDVCFYCLLCAPIADMSHSRQSSWHSASFLESKAVEQLAIDSEKLGRATGDGNGAHAVATGGICARGMGSDSVTQNGVKLEESKWLLLRKEALNVATMMRLDPRFNTSARIRGEHQLLLGITDIRRRLHAPEEGEIMIFVRPFLNVITSPETSGVYLRAYARVVVVVVVVVSGRRRICWTSTANGDDDG